MENNLNNEEQTYLEKISNSDNNSDIQYESVGQFKLRFY